MYFEGVRIHVVDKTIDYVYWETPTTYPTPKKKPLSRCVLSVVYDGPREAQAVYARARPLYCDWKQSPPTFMGKFNWFIWDLFFRQFRV